MSKSVLRLITGLVLTRAASSSLVLISPAKDSTDTFYITAKSKDQVVPEGSLVPLTCQVNEAWDLCGFITPDDILCDRLDSSKYVTACHNNDRVRYERTSSGDKCSVHIVGAQATDSGKWTCLLKDNVLSPLNVSEHIQVSVASPYKLSLAPEEPVIVLGGPSNQTDDQIVCTATGGGAVDPVLEWQVNGHKVEPHRLHTWEEDDVSGNRLLFLALPLIGDGAREWQGDEEGQVSLRCLSKQFFPNGTIIYESFKSTQLTLLEQEIVPQAEERTSDVVVEKNVAGIVITSIIVFAVLIALGFLLYALKCKKFCYAPGKRKFKPVNQDGEEDNESIAFFPPPPTQPGLNYSIRNVQPQIARADVRSSSSATTAHYDARLVGNADLAMETEPQIQRHARESSTPMIPPAEGTSEDESVERTEIPVISHNVNAEAPSLEEDPIRESPSSFSSEPDSEPELIDTSMEPERPKTDVSPSTVAAGDIETTQQKAPSRTSSLDSIGDNDDLERQNRATTPAYDTVSQQSRPLPPIPVDIDIHHPAERPISVPITPEPDSPSSAPPSAPPLHEVPPLGTEEELLRMIHAHPNVDSSKGTHEILQEEEDREATQPEQRSSGISNFKAALPQVRRTRVLSETLVTPRAPNLKRGNHYVGYNSISATPTRRTSGSGLSAESLGVQLALEPDALRGEPIAFADEDNRTSLDLPVEPITEPQTRQNEAGVNETAL